MRYLLLTILIASCGIDSGAPKPPAPEPTLTDAQRAWLDALPVFEKQCMACHATASQELDFLGGADEWEIRDRLLASGIVSVEEPTRSRLLTKGVHQGPAMTAADAQLILDWLEAELGN